MRRSSLLLGCAALVLASASANSEAQSGGTDSAGGSSNIARTASSNKVSITTEQRARLAQKLRLIDAIVRAAAPDMQARGVSAEQRQWLIESLSGAPLEQLQAMGVPGSFDATVQQLAKTEPVATAVANRRNALTLGQRQNDLVFRPITPCRYIDTRNVGGPIVGSRSYDLNNTGTSYGGSGACNPKASAPFGDENYIGAIAINLTIVSPTSAPGFMGARPFGSTNNTSLVNWYQTGASVQAANAGIVMTDQTGALDEIEFFGSPAQIIVDVFGIFTAPAPTGLDCVQGPLTTVNVANGGIINFSPGACPAGYTAVSLTCHTSGMFTGTTWVSSGITTTGAEQCQGSNNSGVAQNYNAAFTCCRVPGL
jgi:hypothetical protein